MCYSFLIIGCSKQDEAQTLTNDQPIRVENGISVYQLHCDGFANLSQQMKLYAYHLIQACKQGESLDFDQTIVELEQAFIYAPTSSREPLTEFINQLRGETSDLTQYRKLWLTDTSSQVDYHMDVTYSSDRADTLFTGFVAIKETDRSSESTHQLLYSLDPFCVRSVTVLISEADDARQFLFSNIPTKYLKEQRIFLMPTIELHTNKMGGIKRIELKE